jgi:hypothetical protein
VNLSIQKKFGLRPLECTIRRLCLCARQMHATPYDVLANRNLKAETLDVAGDVAGIPTPVLLALAKATRWGP